MSIRSVVCLTLTVVLAGCTEEPQVPVPTAATPTAPATAETAAESTPVIVDGKLKVNQLVFSIPSGWQSKPASSGFVLAEFALPRAEGDEADGRLTVSVAGGSVEANIERWRDQFGGKPAQASQDEKEIDGLKVTLVDLGGDFSDQRGPFAPATKRAGYRMLAAVIPVEGELHFVKAVGPQATMAAHHDRFHEFIASVEKQ
jgi:hypothetical protein